MNKIILTSLLLFVACDKDNYNGESCDDNNDCTSNRCLTHIGDEHNGLSFPDGMCTNECNEDYSGCDKDDETCLGYTPTGKFYCFQNCLVDDDCRLGYFCLGFPGEINACVPEGA